VSAPASRAQDLLSRRLEVPAKRNTEGSRTSLPPSPLSLPAAPRSHASSILRCLCRSLRCRSFSFLPPPAGCCVPLAASAEGSTACTASSTVPRRPALADGSVRGRLLSPRDVLVSPPPPLCRTARHPLRHHRPWPLPLPLCCAQPLRAHHALSGEALTRATQTPRRSPDRERGALRTFLCASSSIIAAAIRSACSLAAAAPARSTPAPP
jgi:hypothetical protein